MPQFERITLIIESLPGARAQVQVNIPTPTPGMRLETPAHALAIDALGWLGKQPAVAGFVYGGAPETLEQANYLRKWFGPDTEKAARLLEIQHARIQELEQGKCLHQIAEPAASPFMYAIADSRFLRLLQWSAEDLADPVIRADADRLEQERQTAVKRLAPHIEELVALAWAQLQAGNSSGSSKEAP